MLTMADRSIEVYLNANVILDVNFQYEKLCITKDYQSSKHAMLFLLLGNVVQNKVFRIQKPISVVLTSDLRTGRFIIDKEQVSRRLELCKTTNPEFDILGVMVINEKLFDYSEVIRMLLIDYNQKFSGKALLFSYTTSDDMSIESRKRIFQDSYNKLNLKCSIIEDYNLNLIPIEFKINSTDVSIPIHADSSKSNELDQITVTEEIEYFDAKKSALKKEVTRIIEYLKRESTVDDPLNPMILNKIAIIVHILEGGPTEDIQESIQKMENEIRLIQLSLEQWEIVNLKSKKPDT